MYTGFIMKDINKKWAIHPLPKGRGLLAGQAKSGSILSPCNACIIFMTVPS
jgi:hypothetical protein